MWHDRGGAIRFVRLSLSLCNGHDIFHVQLVLFTFRRFFLFGLGCTSSADSSTSFLLVVVLGNALTKHETKKPLVASSPGKHRTRDAASPVTLQAQS